MSPKTMLPDTAVLFNAERRELAGLGFRLMWKFQDEIDLMRGDCMVAIVRLMPASHRAHRALKEQGPEGKDAEFIEAEQKFFEPGDAIYALGDAIRAGLELARDAV